jgi:molecular chaperone GrpE (heat shock protein)
MRNRYVILSLLLLIAGATALKWSFTEREKEKHLQQEYQEILKANLAKVDKLVAGQTDVRPSADIILSENLQQQLDKYRAREDTIELAFNISVVCILIGGGFLTSWLLLTIARLLIRFFSCLIRFFTALIRRQRKNGYEKPADNYTKEDEKDLDNERKQPKRKSEAAVVQYDGRDSGKYSSRQLKKKSKVLVDSGWHSLNKDYVNQQEHTRPQTDVPVGNKFCSYNRDRRFDKVHSPGSSVKNAGKVAVLLSDEEFNKSEEFLEAAPENPNVNTMPFEHSTQSSQQTSPWSFNGESLTVEDSLKTQTENLGKQMAELSAVAKAIQQISLEHSEPLSNTLAQLTEQVAAIREYAGQQQERVEKLQEGYDWNIIRTFCLRVIRCIDNVESRINHLDEQNIDTSVLKEIRDELIFALESSGVEQFEPEINSDYCGQEKAIEAIKNKEPAGNPKLKGKIAKVIRPGYRHIISEENIKIIRTAQVKLFG